MAQCVALGLAANGTGLRRGTGSVCPVVTGGGYFAIRIAVAANGAGMGGVAVLGAGGRGGDAFVAMGHGGAALGTGSVCAVAVMGAIHRHIAQGQCIIAVIHQREGDLLAAGNGQQRTIADRRGIIQHHRGAGVLLPIGHVPAGIVAGLQTDAAILPEGHHQRTVHELIFAQLRGIFAPGVVRAVDMTEQIIIRFRLREAAGGTNIILIGMDAGDAAGIALALRPRMGTTDAADGALPFDPVVRADEGADLTGTAFPAMGTAAIADGTYAVAPAMGAGQSADGTDPVLVAVGADCTAVADAIHIAVRHSLSAHGADTGSVVEIVRTVHRLIAELVSIVAVVDQREGDLHIAGDEQLIFRKDGVRIDQRDRGLPLLIAIGHIPAQIIGGLHAHIAIRGKISGQRTILKFVDTQIFAVRLIRIVGPIDIAEQIVVQLGLFVAANGADIVLIAVEDRFTTGSAQAILTVAFVDAYRFIAQNVGIIPIVRQGEGHLFAAGNIQLVRIGQSLGVVKRRASHLPLPTVGHIPVGIIGGFHRHIAVGGELHYHLAVHKFVFAQVGVVLFAAIVRSIDVSEQIIVIHRLRLTANGADIVLIAVVTFLAADGAAALGHGVFALQTADAEAIRAVGVLHRIAADRAKALCRMARMLTFHCHIAQQIGIVPIIGQGEGHLCAAGHEQLVGRSEGCSIVKRNRRHIALPAIRHIIGSVVRRFHAHIAILCEEDHHLSVHEFVLAQIGGILLAGVVRAVDPAEKIIVIHRLRKAAVRTDIVLIAVGAGGTAQGADPLVIPCVGRIGALHIAVQRAGLHLPVIGGGDRLIAPVRPVGPTLVGILLLVVCMLLLIHIGHEEPVGVGGAGRMGGLIAHIRGIAGVVAGRCGAVIGVEGGIAPGLIGGRIVGIGVAPVVVQVAADRVAVDDTLGGLVLEGGDLLILVVVLGIEVAAGIEAGGPAADILHRAGGCRCPFAAGLSIAVQRRFLRGQRLLIRIAVDRLCFQQAFVDPLGLGLLPLGQQMLRIGHIAVAAEGAGVADLLIFRAGSSNGLSGIAVSAIGDCFLVDMAAGGAGIYREAIVDAVRRLEDRFGIAVGAGALIHAGADTNEVLHQQIHGAAANDHGIPVRMVALILGRDHIGMLTSGNGIKQSIIIDITIDQGVRITGNGIRIAGDDVAIGAKAGADIDRCPGQRIISGTNPALDQEIVSGHMGGRHGGTGNGDIIHPVFQITGVRRFDIADRTGGGLDLIPQLPFRILIQMDRRVSIAGAGGLQHRGAALYRADTRQAHNGSAVDDLNVAIADIAGTSAGIAVDRQRGGRQDRLLRAGAGGRAAAGEIAVGIPQHREFLEGHRIVQMPVPHFRGVRPHPVTQAVKLAGILGRRVIAAVPDLLLRADAGIVAPNQEISAAQIGSRHILHILGVVAMLADIRRVPLVEDVLLVGVVEGPLAIVHASGIGAAAGDPQSVVGVGLDAVVEGHALFHIVADRLRMVAVAAGAGIKGRVPIEDLDVIGKIIVGSVIGGAAHEVVVHPHGIAHAVEQGVQLVDIHHEIRKIPRKAVAGGDVGGIQIDLVRADAEIGAAGVLLEEVGDIDIQLENERFILGGGDVDGGIVGPLQRRRPAGGIRIIDAAPHIGGIVGLLDVGGVKGIIRIGLVILLVRPSQVVHMGGAVEGWDHIDMIFFGGLEDLHHLSGGQIFTAVRIVLIGGQGPGGIVAAADPGEVIGRLEVSRIVRLVPDIQPEAGVIGKMQLQRVVAHP